MCKSSERWFEASHVRLTSLPEHPSSSAGTRGISKQNLVLPCKIKQQDLRGFFPPLALTLSSKQSQYLPAPCRQQQQWPVAALLWESLSNGWDSKRSSATCGCRAPCNRPLGNAPSIAPAPPAGRAHTSAWPVKGDRGTTGNRKSLDINLPATCVWQTSTVIYPGITSEKKELNSHLLLVRKL